MPEGQGSIRDPFAPVVRRLRRRSTTSRRAWHDHPKRGKCPVCRRRATLIAHHVVLEQLVVRLDRSLRWDTRNRWVLGWDCGCHENHHTRGVTDRRLPYEKIPKPARVFALELLGKDQATAYFYRRYQGAPRPNFLDP